ncbi:protein of unknown function [Rhodovastum atsumiense]|nr:protein of unknown function [Rhodovastum atsumiense]
MFPDICAFLPVNVAILGQNYLPLFGTWQHEYSNVSVIILIN